MTLKLPQIEDYQSLFLNNVPMLDVRAPIEFKQGAFPFTQNIPLLTDKERADIGTRYKNLGQDAAIKLGHQLIQGKIKSERVDSWVHFFEQQPQAVLYCFRGGMRSKISQQWIYERTGTLYPRIKGGYKAMRRFLINELEISAQHINPVILSGKTGVGKTLLLNTINQKVDLEGLYHHRGSVFGKHATPQPTQIDIENALSIELLKHRHYGNTQILLEDEGSNIGSRRTPECLIQKMQHGDIVLLEASIEERVNITFQEYIIEDLAAYQTYYGKQQGFQQWTEKLKHSIDKIQRRLGGLRHKELKTLLSNAIQQQITGNIEAHKNWIEVLLVQYYDPMYNYQLSKKQQRVVFKGKRNEVHSYLTTKYKIS